jgi:regulator of RNase E activity RraB
MRTNVRDLLNEQVLKDGLITLEHFIGKSDIIRLNPRLIESLKSGFPKVFQDIYEHLY